MLLHYSAQPLFALLGYHCGRECGVVLFENLLNGDCGTDEVGLLKDSAHLAEEDHRAVTRGAVAHRDHPIGVFVGNIGRLTGEEQLELVASLKSFSTSLLTLVQIDGDAVAVDILLFSRDNMSFDSCG